MMFTRSSARITFLLALTLIVLIVPNLIRTSDTYIGEDPYLYSRLAEKINNNDVSYDDLSYSGRTFTYSLGQPLVFLFFTKFLPERFVVYIIPLIFALISLYLFYLILKEFYIEPNVIYLSLIILILSPPFIYIFTSYTKFTAITLILLLTIYLSLKKDKTSEFISYLLYFIIPFFGYQYSVFILLLSFIYFKKENNIKRFKGILLSSLASLIIIYLPLIIKYGFFELVKFDRYLKYKSLFSDLGSEFGTSIFILFLSFFGISYLWKFKYKYTYVYLTLLLFIIFLFFLPSFIVYINFILAYLAALGIVHLLRSKWESETIRRLTMWLLIIGVIFSAITFINQVSQEKPNNNLYNALNYLKGYDSDKTVVFSHYSYGNLINTIANKKNVMDTNFLYAPRLNQHYQDSQLLLNTRNADLASELVKKYNIEYILITKEMKQGLVWNQEDEGLLFVVNSANIYKRIYYNDEVEIWRIKE